MHKKRETYCQFVALYRGEQRDSVLIKEFEIAEEADLDRAANIRTRPGEEVTLR